MDRNANSESVAARDSVSASDRDSATASDRGSASDSASDTAQKPALTPALNTARINGAAAALSRVKPFSFGLIGTLGVLIALLIGSIIGQLATVLVYIGIALFLSLGLDPIVRWLERKMSRPLSVTVVVVAVIAGFAGIMLAVIPLIVTQIATLIEDAPQLIEDFTTSQWFVDITNQYGDTLDNALQGALSFIQDPNNLTQIGGGLLAVGAGITGGVTGVIIVLILTLYFMASLKSMKQVSARFIAAYARPRYLELLEDVSGAVGRYVIGQASLALINGVLSLIFLTIIGAPLPILLALIAFIGSLIPLVGTLSGAIINTLICLFASPLTALVALIYYLIYLQIEAYILSPRIMSKAVAVPGAIVVIAAVGGGALGGVLGALVAIPIAASIIIVIQKVLFPVQDAKTTAPE